MKQMHYCNITYLCDSSCKFCAANIGMINHDGYTITPQEFEKRLLGQNVQPGDIVMISGGEPSLSPFFWDILDICQKYDCYIELTTNGHSFYNRDVALRLYSYKKINVQISCFGLQERHDYLTGRIGNYEKMLGALYNFAAFELDSSFSISVKFLLCKATVEGNKQAFAELYSIFGDRLYYYLSALLVSSKVILNRAELLEPYSDTLRKLGDFVENEKIRIDTIPLCLLSEKKRNAFLRQKQINLEKLYSDAKINNKEMDNYICRSCSNCKLFAYCDRFLPSYIEVFGSSEIKPF